MATTRQIILHDNLLGGMDSTLPAWLLKPTQWRRQHQMRNTPSLEQVPKKITHTTFTSSGTIKYIGVIPNYIPGYGKLVSLSDSKAILSNGTVLTSGLTTSSAYTRWSVVLYNGALYYVNELNAVRRNNGSTDVAVSNAPKARYLLEWFDHLVCAYPTYQGSVYPDRVMWSDLYNFSTWEPAASNEADHYDVVEWQLADYPYSGITGLAKINGICWVFTPTAIVPFQYVGKPKVTQLIDQSVVTGCGNTYPWSMVAMNNVAFFYDGIEKNFFAFTGQLEPIGEPVRRFITENLNTDPSLASRMWACVDIPHREVWWRFCSAASSGTFDMAVVFNYRTKQWFTASTENVHAFCGPTFRVKTVAELTGAVSALTGTCGALGLDGTQIPSLYGSVSGSDGKLYRDELSTDATASLVAADDPYLESRDEHYGDGHSQKEVDIMYINATFQECTNFEVRVKGRDYFTDPVDWTVASTKVGDWSSSSKDGQVNFAAKSGRILRYRFKGVGARALKFSTYADGVYLKKADA